MSAKSSTNKRMLMKKARSGGGREMWGKERWRVVTKSAM